MNSRPFLTQAISSTIRDESARQPGVAVQLQEYMLPLSGCSIPVKIKVDIHGNLFAARYTMKQINSAFNLAGPQIGGTVDFSSNCRVEKRLTLGSKESITTLTKHLLAVGGRVPLLHEGRANLSVVAAMMMTLPGFGDAYEYYADDHDEGVIVSKGDPQDEENYDQALVEANIIPTDGTPGPQAMSESEAKAIAYLVLLFMSKKLVNSEQYEKVMEARVKAMCLALGYYEVPLSTLKRLLHYEDVKDLADKMSFFPKFKVIVYQTVLIDLSPYCLHIRGILRESQMTIFNFIFFFICNPLKTQLHTARIIFREMKIWIAKYKLLKEMYGDNWLFYKLLEPQGMISSVTDIPNLASAALSYIYVHRNTGGTQMNIQGYP